MRKSFLFILFLLVAIQAKAQLFKKVDFPLQGGFKDSKMSICDFDNDGFMDLYITGIDSADKKKNIFIRNHNGETFSDILCAVRPTTSTTVSPFDFDNDGLIDLLVSGKDSSDKFSTRLYINRSGFNFGESRLFLDTLQGSTHHIVDLDNDGRKDFIVTGLDSGGMSTTRFYKNYSDSVVIKKTFLDSIKVNKISTIDFDKDGFRDLLVEVFDSLQHPKINLYKNLNDLQFKKITTVDGLNNSKLSFGDFNLDARTDFLVTGENQDKEYSTKLYLADTSFAESDLEIPGLEADVTHIVDLNHDGFPEIFLAGKVNDTINNAWIYEGDTSGVEPADSIKLLKNGFLSLGDVNNDGNLDIIMTGLDSGKVDIQLYLNQTSQKNLGPSKPGRPIVIPMLGKVFFTWKPTSDDVTPQTGLSYELFVGRSNTTAETKAPESDMNTGFRRVVAHGSSGQSTHYMIGGLKEGRYNWGVQAIDNSFIGHSASGGFCLGGGSGNGFNLCFDINYKDTTICKSSIIKIASPTKDSIFIYSSVKGYLGSHVSYNYKASKSDTLYVVSTNYEDCAQSMGYRINLLPDTALNIGKDKIVCPGEQVSLSLDNSKWKNVKWYVNNIPYSEGSGMTLVVKTPVTIKAEAYSLANCLFVDSMKVDVYKPTVVFPEAITLTYGEALNVEPAGVLSYELSSSDNKSERVMLTDQIYPRNNITYYLKAIDLNGCNYSDSLKVTVTGDTFIPNLFTPNGDGANETFKIYGPNIREVTLQIFNRSGTLVYEGKGIDILEKGWDGKKNGMPLESGAYVWTLKGLYTDGRELEFNGKKSGTIRILR